MGEEEGLASFYHDSLHGNLTASGAPYDKRGYTAAHQQLPFGTWVSVVNLENNKRVLVQITDRGPFVEGRVIDLSRRAARALGMLDEGVADVRIDVLD
jgi:rare lipoprotein A